MCRASQNFKHWGCGSLGTTIGIPAIVKGRGFQKMGVLFEGRSKEYHLPGSLLGFPNYGKHHIILRIRRVTVADTSHIVPGQCSGSSYVVRAYSLTPSGWVTTVKLGCPLFKNT